MRRFKEMKEEFEVIGDVGRLGLMIGIEMVKDKAFKEQGKYEAHKIMKRS